MCEFLVSTGDPCSQPPRLVPYQCCGWGFAPGDCPLLPEGQDARCVLPIGQNVECSDEGLTCQVVASENASPADYVCCNGFFQQGSGC